MTDQEFANPSAVTAAFRARSTERATAEMLSGLVDKSARPGYVVIDGPVGGRWRYCKAATVDGRWASDPGEGTVAVFATFDEARSVLTACPGAARVVAWDDVYVTDHHSMHGLMYTVKVGVVA